MTPLRSTGDYRHDEKRRKNNPPVGMVAYEVKIAEQPPTHYGYDPHHSPQLIWAGKPGLINVEVEDAAGLAVDTVSLHIRPDVLLTDARGESLLKTTASAQLFTVFGEPDIELRRRDDGAYEVELLGVDVYDPLTGEVHSARASQVTAWFLDSDYDRRTFHIRQAFFPNKSAWKKLAHALKGTLNDDLFDQLTGRISLPFEPGDHRRIAVKVIDQRGNEVMRVVRVIP